MYIYFPSESRFSSLLTAPGKFCHFFAPRNHHRLAGRCETAPCLAGCHYITPVGQRLKPILPQCVCRFCICAFIGAIERQGNAWYCTPPRRLYRSFNDKRTGSNTVQIGFYHIYPALGVICYVEITSFILAERAYGIWGIEEEGGLPCGAVKLQSPDSSRTIVPVEIDALNIRIIRSTVDESASNGAAY